MTVQEESRVGARRAPTVTAFDAGFESDLIRTTILSNDQYDTAPPSELRVSAVESIYYQARACH